MVKKFHRDVELATPRADTLRLSVDVRQMQAVAREARAAGISMKSLAAGAAATASGFVAAAAGIAALELGASGLADVFQQIKSSVSMAAELEQNTIAFEVMLGSAERAKETIAGLRKFAAETPFSSREVMQSAKLLMGMGTPGDQLVPQLKMLGHHASIDPKNAGLERMAYLYGTMQTTGRVYTRDLNQLTGAGIDVLPVLAEQLKITKEKIREFAEEGKLDSNDLGRALESMTLKGGKLFGILDKQAASLSGAWEQMTDAFDMAKIRFGQIVIEQTGLKGVVKDLEAFGKGLQSGIDTEVLKRAIKMGSDFAKGVVNVGYELAKGLGQSASIFGEMASQVPVFKDTLRTVESIIGGMKEFKLDPVTVAQLAVDFGKDALAGATTFAILVEHMAGNFKHDILDPTVEAIKEIRKLIGDVKAFRESVSPPKRIEGLRDFAERAGGFKLEDALELRPKWVKEFEKTELGRKDVANPDAPFARVRESAKKLADSLDKIAKAGDEVVRRLKEQKEAERMVKVQAEADKHFADLEGLSEVYRGLQRGRVGSVLGMSPLNPLHGLLASNMAFRGELERFNVLAGLDRARDLLGVSGGLLRFRTSREESGLRFENKPRQNIIDLAKKLNDEFDPVPELMRRKAEMEQALKFGLIDQGTFNLGWNKEVRGVADRLGIGSQPHLADAVIAGSQEDARLLSNFMAGTQQQTTETLLTQIRDLLAAMKSAGLMGENGIGAISVAATGGG